MQRSQTGDQEVRHLEDASDSHRSLEEVFLSFFLSGLLSSFFPYSFLPFFSPFYLSSYLLSSIPLPFLLISLRFFSSFPSSFLFLISLIRFNFTRQNHGKNSIN